MTSFSVVIPTWNEAGNISAVLHGLQSLDLTECSLDVVVVDNGSSDRTVAIAREAGATVIENRSGKRKTIAALRNSGAAATRGEILAFLDGDMLVPQDWLQQAAEHFSHAQNQGALGFAETVPPGAGWVAQIWGTRDLFVRREARAVDFLPGRNLLVSREVFTAVGGFDESLTTNEDKEFTYRVVRAGYRAIYRPDAVTIHLGYEKDLAEFVRKEFWRQSTTLRFARRWGFTPRTLRNPLMSFGHLFALGGTLLCALSGWTLLAGVMLLCWVLPAGLIAWRGKCEDASNGYLGKLFFLTWLRWNVAGAALVWQLKEGEPFRRGRG